MIQASTLLLIDFQKNKYPKDLEQVENFSHCSRFGHLTLMYISAKRISVHQKWE